jgi:acetyl esterase/lipase
MRFQDYPPQPDASGAAAAYRDACIAGSFGVPFSEYAFGSDPHQSIAVYPAAGGHGPLFAFLHGGGWDRGYKETMGFMAPCFTQAGITFASIGYRLAPQHLFPDGLEDTMAAVRALHERAELLGYDRNRIFLGGHSAGGHYAALLAVQRNWQARHGLPRDVIKGCLPLSGVYFFGEGAGFAQRPRFLGAEGRGVERDASPLLNIEHPAPFLIAYGERDFPHLMRQAKDMVEALRKADCAVECVVLPGRDHFGSSLAGGERNGPWVAHAIAFIRSHAHGAASERRVVSPAEPGRR